MKEILNKQPLKQSEGKVGVFDSGVGGLSILRVFRERLPGQPIIYFADQHHVPYGPRPVEEIRAFSEEISRYLISRGVVLIIVACNTASAAALEHIRKTFPQIDFVGMEPAVKPAAERTTTGVIGVLATPATLKGNLFVETSRRFAQHVKVFKHPCPGLVEQIEAGNLSGQQTRSILENALNPMLENNVDTIVLGCTHYPFVLPLIKEIVGQDIEVIEPANAIARRSVELLEKRGLLQEVSLSKLEIITSGDPKPLKRLLPLMGKYDHLKTIEWQSGKLSYEI
ncbi:MAG: glutamate racemase [Anaerolineaceae bacterium]|nr:glutamate racemase [Anaerolineaceae bacterium]